MKHLYFVYHVPKTGGQTIRKHLEANLARDRDFVHLHERAEAKLRTAGDIAGINASARDQLKVICGHPLTRQMKEFFPTRTIREVVIVREPAERLVSRFNYRCTRLNGLGQPLQTLEEFREWLGPNEMTKFLAARLQIPQSPTTFSTLLAELGNMWLVGTLPSMDTLTPALYSAIGLDAIPAPRSNVTGVHVDAHATLTPNLAEELREENPLDVLLYQACHRLEQRTLERLGIVERRPARRAVLFAQ